MTLLRASLAALAGLVCLIAPISAEAHGRSSAGPAVELWPRQAALHAPRSRRSPAAVAIRSSWGGGALASEAARYVGSGKFTALPGPWCADAVNAWLRGVGKPPLRGRMAGDALAYGPRGYGAPGELAVFLDRRGRAYHVGVVAANLGDRVEIISGNWGHRVARAIVSRRGVVFVGV